MHRNLYINEFDNSIENFKIIGDTPKCKQNGEYRELIEFGDGLRHYISIISSLYTAKDGYLFIDEIGNGIHYTHLPKLWELIFKLSHELNVQIFATTHSKECIEQFLAYSDDEARFITLYKHTKSGKINATVSNKDELSYELAHGGDVRGE